MSLMIVGLVLFIGVHLVPAMAPLKRILVLKLGAAKYKGLFALVSIAGLVFIVLGWREATLNISSYWQPVSWASIGAAILMYFGLFFFFSNMQKTNLQRITAHPMTWGVVLWASAHLLANGDEKSVNLFGTFLAYSLFAIWSANQRGAKASKEKVDWLVDLKRAAIVGVVFSGLFYLHEYISGVALT